MQQDNYYRVTINNLDSLCLQNILEYLPLRQRVKAGEVNKTWNTIAQRYWTKIHILGIYNGSSSVSHTTTTTNRIFVYDHNDFRFSIGILKNCGQYLRKLYIEVMPEVNKVLLGLAHKYCHNLLSVKLSLQDEADAELVHRLLSANSNLERISLVVDDPSDYHCLEAVPVNTLTSFYLDCPFIINNWEMEEDAAIILFSVNLMGAVKQIIRNSPCLRIFMSRAMDDEMLILLTQKPTIKSIILPMVLPQYFTEEGLSCIFNMTRLERLCMEFQTPWPMPLINDNFIIQLVRKCKNIKQLLFAGCGLRISDIGGVHLKHLKYLKRLTICNAPNITDVSVKNLVYLKTLSLAHCEQVGDVGIIELLRRTPTLQKIILVGTSITEMTIICANEFTRRRKCKTPLEMYVTITAYIESLRNQCPLFRVCSYEVTNEWHSNNIYF